MIRTRPNGAIQLGGPIKPQTPEEAAKSEKVRELERRSGHMIRYEIACRAVADAASVDEVKEIRDQAEAMRAYAKQAKHRKMEIDAAEIRIRAERRLGEIMALQKAAVGVNTGGRPKTGSDRDPVSDDTPATLAEAGIDKHLADRARTYAAVPEQKFEEILKKKRKRDNGRVTIDPDFQAEADAAEKERQIEHDERVAEILSRGDPGLVAENERLTALVKAKDAELDKLRLHNRGLSEEVSDLKRQLKKCRERNRQ